MTDRDRGSEHAPLPAVRGTDVGWGGRLLYRACWLAMRAASALWFRLEIRGAERLPRTGAYIVAPVHRSNLDTPLMAMITSRRFRYMGKESLWRSRFGAWFLTAIGGFPVERGTADRAALRACQAILARGEPLVMFPEGTRRSGPLVLDENMHDGPAFVAARSRVPIVPVGIGGSEDAMPKGAKFIRPRKIVIVVGDPIPPPEPGEGGRVPRRAVAETTKRLQDEVQRLFDEAQALAGG